MPTPKVTEKPLMGPDPIKNKIIAGAGIDVTSQEPPLKSHIYYSINKYKVDSETFTGEQWLSTRIL